MEAWNTYQTMDTAEIDLRLQSLRQRDQAAERCLLESIQLQGIKEPLLVVADPEPGRTVLLDGFKRYRCARRLSIGVIPVRCIEGDERAGLLTLLRESRGKGLSELEYGAIIDMLAHTHGMNITQIAAHLGCSVAWVCLRRGLVRSMTPAVRKAVLEDRFPSRCFMYTLRPFTRVKGLSPEVVERFVLAVSGRKLSTREIFLLMRAYFDDHGGLQKRIEQGEIGTVLEALKSDPVVDGSEYTARLIEKIAHTRSCMDGLIQALPDATLEGEVTCLRARLGAQALLRCMGNFTKEMRRFYDRTTKALGGDGVVAGGNETETHRADVGAGSQDRQGDHCLQRATTVTAQQIPVAAAV